jgi:deoxyribodipyrimidine photo-lyase
MPFTVFGAFRRAWKALPLPTSEGLLPAPLALPSPSALECEPLPQVESPPGFPAGETEAQRRLDAFLGGPVHHYDSGRNRLDQDGTSALSPYLRFGMLSARTAVVKAYQARDAARAAEGREAIEAWIDELIWRDFYIAVLSHFPHLARDAFRPSMDRICWENDAALLDAWKSGRTGYPVVDAAMRQLLQSGWMHNRARMIVASFLTKDLLMDWRLGERWFRQNLIDGDPAANIGGWQWTAGTGTDAAPYFRVFNPVLQGAKFDPQGAFVRRYVPELANVPAAFIHRPWKMPLERQAELGCIIGRDYPVPVVEHAWARERALLAYRTAASDAARQRPPRNEYTQRRSS